MRVRSEAAFALHSFFNDNGFVYVHTPLITASDCEGAGEMFRVTTLDMDNVPKSPDGKVDYGKDFFGKSANLTVSGQLNAEAYVMAFGKVYTLKYVINHILTVCPDEIAFFNNFVDNGLKERLTKLVNSKFERMTYTKAIELLAPHNDQFEFPVSWGCDIATEHEKYLTRKSSLSICVLTMTARR